MSKSRMWISVIRNTTLTLFHFSAAVDRKRTKSKNVLKKIYKQEKKIEKFRVKLSKKKCFIH